MDDDAPVLLGKLAIKCDSNQPQSEFPAYQPPLAILPQLVTLISNSNNNQNNNNSKSDQRHHKSATINNNSSSFVAAGSVLNRERSFWDVSALRSFREGNNNQRQQQQASSSSSSPKFKSAREALASLVASGKLPGGNVASSSSTSTSAIIPSTMDIVKALDKFASEIGVGKDDQADEIGAALRSQHFLHLLGFQRLEQLRGNLHAVLLSNNNESNSASPGDFNMSTFGEERHENNKNKNNSNWVSDRSKLYDAVLNLVSSDKKNGNANASNFWAVPPPKSSIEIQTDREQELKSEGVINWSHPSNDKNSTKSIKADEKLTCSFPANTEMIAGWSVVISTQSVSQESNDRDNINSEASIKIPLTSPRTFFGRSLSSGTIRQRMNDEVQANNNNNDNEEETLLQDPRHIDLSSIVRKLTNRLDHGLYISREHFVLSFSNNNNNNSFTLLPCSRNFTRVNGSVCYAAPVHGLASGDVITVGSGNTSPAGIVILIKLVKE